MKEIRYFFLRMNKKCVKIVLLFEKITRQISRICEKFFGGLQIGKLEGSF